MNIAQLAIRNVERKRARLLVTAGAMGMAGAMVIFFSCLMDGFYGSTIANIIDNESGHMQVHAVGWRDDPDLYKSLASSTGAMAALRAKGLECSGRLVSFGLAAHGEASAGVEMRGLDLAAEARVSKLHTRVLKGAWLEAGDPRGVVLGAKLADKLEAKPGDELVLLAQAADGSMANELVKVRGVLMSVSARSDEAGLLVSEAFFRDFFRLEQGWHEVAVRVPGQEPDLEAARRELRAAFPGGEALTWKELQPMIASLVDAQDAGMIVFMTIAYLAVGLVVFNAMLMNVFERVREFGIMKALGVEPLRVFAIIAIEAVLEAVVASVLALLVGLPLARWFQLHPIDLRYLMPKSFTMAGLAFEPVFGTQLSWRSVLEPLAFLFVLSLVAVVYPALKAARLDPLAAIQHR